MSLASLINRQADAMLERSTWGSHRPPLRILIAFGCWTLAMAVGLLIGFLFEAPTSFAVLWSAAFGLWVGLMLGAYVTGSRTLMRVTLWSIAGLGVLPIVLGIASA